MVFLNNYYALIGYVILGGYLAVLQKRKISTYLFYIIASSSFLFASNFSKITSINNILILIYGHLLIFWSTRKIFFETKNLENAELIKKYNFYYRWFLRYYSLILYFTITIINLNFIISSILLIVPFITYVLINLAVIKINKQ